METTNKKMPARRVNAVERVTVLALGLRDAPPLSPASLALLAAEVATSNAPVTWEQLAHRAHLRGLDVVLARTLARVPSERIAEALSGALWRIGTEGEGEQEILRAACASMPSDEDRPPTDVCEALLPGVMAIREIALKVCEDVCAPHIQALAVLDAYAEHVDFDLAEIALFVAAVARVLERDEEIVLARRAHLRSV